MQLAYAIAFFLTSLVLPAAFGAQTAAASPAEPLLSVAEDLGAARRSWPLSTGFPFPAGAVTDPTTLYLQESGGSVSTPLQARTLSRWPDGSLRWVLLDASLDLDRRQKRTFRVRSGTPPKAEGVRVTDGPDAFVIDTGALRFSIPKTRLALLEGVFLRGEKVKVGPVTPFLRLQDERETAPPPKSVTLVEQGPVRARVEIRGAYAAGIEYVIRIDAFRGQPFVRVLHTFENHRDEPYLAIRTLAVDVPFEFGSRPSYAAGRVGEAPLTGRVSARGVQILQQDNLTLRYGERSAAGQAAGWIDVRGDAQGVAVAARYFWQEYPQAFSLKPSRLTYEMWGSPTPLVAGMGAAKTHEMVIAFHGAEPPAPAETNAFITPLIGRLDPQWVRDSGALPQAIARSAGTSKFLRGLGKAYARYQIRTEQEEWDDSGQTTCASGSREVRRRGAYGMWNWGDWNFPTYHDDTKGCDAWGNLEYDLAQVLALGFAATQDRDYFDGMVVAARHFMDVDIIHHQRAHPKWVGMNHPKNPLHFTFEMGGVDLGHAWNEGLLSYYYLTGDERGRDAALGIADYLEKRIRGSGVRGNPRQWGWPQIALAAAYEATLEPRYRAAADAYARGGLRAHPPAAAHWKLGILADALAYTHATTADEALKKEIRAWLATYAELARKADVRDPRFFPAIAYVGALDGDQAALDAARAAVARLKFGSWGKPLTLAGRIGFRILSLTEAKSEVPPAPVCGETATPRPSQTARAKANPK